MKMKTKKLIISILCILLVAMIIWVIWGNTALEVNEYQIKSGKIPRSFSGFRIAQISDLHNAEFGEENKKLLTMLARTEPDIIVITGDLIDSRRTDVGISLDFVRQAVLIAPVYYVSGNHEARVAEFEDLKTGMAEAGVTILENEKRLLTRDGESITMMGVEDPSFSTDYLFGDAALVMNSRLTELNQDSDSYTVLLSHRPELFETYVDSGVNLVLSGHAHGGQFRLPFVGGLVAPNQGFFPRYDAGLFMEENTTMIVSRGIGNSIVPLRFNNRPEIVVVELVSDT